MSDAAATRDLPAFSAELRALCARRAYFGGQAFAWFAGAVVADAAWGEAQPGQPATTDTPYPLYCAASPVLACAAAQLVDRGQLSWMTRVVDVVPEFGQHDKTGITLRDVLTHTAGLPQAVDAVAREDVFEACCSHRVPDDHVWGHIGYAPAAWTVVAEVVARAANLPVEHVVSGTITDVGAELQLAVESATYPAWRRRCGVHHVVHEDRRLLHTAPIAAPRTGRYDPAHGAYGPARALGHLYAKLLGCRRGQYPGVLSAAVARELTDRCAPAPDHAEPRVRDEKPRALGFETDFRRHAGPRHAGVDSFGHSGSILHGRVVLAFADPEHDLAMSIVINEISRRGPAWLARLADAIYVDLDLAAPRP